MVRTSNEAPPAAAPAVPTARETASSHFYRGKALALAGDSDCARLEFHEALESFRGAARAGDASDAAFAEQLYDSVLLYRTLIERSTEIEDRPPVENTRDTLIAASPAATEEEVETVKREATAAASGALFDIPIVLNEQVLRAVAFYQFRTPQAFAGALQRLGRYETMMRSLLKERGMPQDLIYIAMIESAFKHQAHSRKAAHGFWQFIDGTAKRYGLRKTKLFDERSDPVKSTLAAASYLRDLYEMFGDWHLAMAAYDAGEGRILRGLQRSGARDYWELSARDNLHRETRDYVPFVLAAALIAKEPARYGFDVVPDPPLTFETVDVTRPVDLARVAEAMGIGIEDLRLLNSELKGRTTPHGVDRYTLRVPLGGARLLAPRLASLPAAPELEERRVAARKGDTVAKVAARYQVTVAELCDWNELTPSSRLRKGMTLVVPVKRPAPRAPARLDRLDRIEAADFQPELQARPRGEIRALPTPASAVTSAADVAPYTTTLTSPAVPTPRPLPSRIDIPAEGFSDVRPEPRRASGQVPPSSSPQLAASASSSSDQTKRAPRHPPTRVVHTVRRGETLYGIAERYGVSVDDLRRRNRLGRREPLREGRRLQITSRPAEGPSQG